MNLYFPHKQQSEQNNIFQSRVCKSLANEGEEKTKNFDCDWYLFLSCWDLLSLHAKNILTLSKICSIIECLKNKCKIEPIALIRIVSCESNKKR